jgi:translation initiation factor 1
MGLFSGTPLERPVTCERCERPLNLCHCPREPVPEGRGRVLLPKDQPARVHRERRRDKTVTVIRGVTAGPDLAPDLPLLVKLLKTRFGTGGTISTTDGAGTKEPSIELQGDHRDNVVEYLRSLGYPARPAGG